jgi:hypothetical protein
MASFRMTWPHAGRHLIACCTYLNRLNNDWLVTAPTFGAPGIRLMLTGFAQYRRRSFVLWMRMDGVHAAVALGRMASIVTRYR